MIAVSATVEMFARSALPFSYLHSATGTRGTAAQGASAQALNCFNASIDSACEIAPTCTSVHTARESCAHEHSSNEREHARSLFYVLGRARSCDS